MRAPIKKNGLRLPNLGDQVLSEMAPIIGCTNKPVTGPAIFNKGRSSRLAPRYVNIGLTAVCCSPKLN